MANTVLRWGGDDAPEDIDEARQRLLDAAEACFTRFGLTKTTVEDIAKAARVSRATVYRYFEGGRDELVLGVILREAERYLIRACARLDKQASLAEAILEFVDHSVRSARRDEALSRIFAVDGGLATGGQVAGRSLALFDKVAEFFEPFFERWSDEVRPGVSAADASEWILRTVLSLLTIEGPKRRGQEATRAYLRRFLIPGIVISSG